MGKKICKECGKEFILTDGEISFFKSKGLNLPKHCKDCRSKNNPRPNISKFSVQTDDYLKANKKINYFKFILPIALVVIVAIVSISEVLNQKSGDTAYTTQNNSNYLTSRQNIKEESETENLTDVHFTFKNSETREEHFKKHGVSMGFKTAEEYEKAASAVISNADSLHKLEAEDNDKVYYLESTNEFVILSTDGYIRTYFLPNDGIEYYERQ